MIRVQALCRNNDTHLRRFRFHHCALGVSLRVLQQPQPIADSRLAEAGGAPAAATVPENRVEIGAKVVAHGRSVTFQMAEVAVPRDMLRMIVEHEDDERRSVPRRGGIGPDWVVKGDPAVENSACRVEILFMFPG